MASFICLLVKNCRAVAVIGLLIGVFDIWAIWSCSRSHLSF
jgi:hypothetical protein